jgi:hypothetical protein
MSPFAAGVAKASAALRPVSRTIAAWISRIARDCLKAGVRAGVRVEGAGGVCARLGVRVDVPGWRVTENKHSNC